MEIDKSWYAVIMRIILIFIFIFIPALSLASNVSDFIVNPQSTYDVSPGATDLLILDLTLPGTGLTSIKINNAGTVQQYDISRLSIYEDGQSPGWDGDEKEIVRKSFSPFFDTALLGNFFGQRIFVTADIGSTTYSGKTIKPEIKVNSAVFSDSALTGPADAAVTGLERKIVAGSGFPYIPLSPLAQKSEAISTSTIRWHFMDLSNNEFGFKILDENLKTVALGLENISYLDETGLEPNTEYSSRKIVAYNDRGQSIVFGISIFPAARTLPLPVVEVTEEPASAPTSTEVSAGEVEASAGKGGPLSPDELRVLIEEIQSQIIELLKQLIQLLSEQLSAAQASLFRAFGGLTDWLQLRF